MFNETFLINYMMNTTNFHVFDDLNMTTSPNKGRFTEKGVFTGEHILHILLRLTEEITCLKSSKVCILNIAVYTKM
jgi:hypothetical protein